MSTSMNELTGLIVRGILQVLTVFARCCRRRSCFNSFAEPPDLIRRRGLSIIWLYLILLLDRRYLPGTSACQCHPLIHLSRICRPTRLLTDPIAFFRSCFSLSARKVLGAELFRWLWLAWSNVSTDPRTCPDSPRKFGSHR